MGDLMEILATFYVIVGIVTGGVALFNSLEDEEVTKGRLITMIVFLPQTIVVGIFFALIAALTWLQDVFTGHNKFGKWWNSPIRTKKEQD